MRSSKSRSRNKPNRQRTLGNIVNRVFDSSGPEGKVRGTPQQVIDKYLALARDAQLSNDRVAEESFLQHAEHYTRMLGEALREQAERQQQSGGGQGRGDDDRRGGREQHRSRDDATEAREARDADAAKGAAPAANGAQPQQDRNAREGDAALPDAIPGDSTDSGPVDLPEARETARSRKAPRRAAAAAAEGGDEGTARQGEGEAAQPARKTTRAPARSRSPRKPAGGDAGGPASSGDQLAAGD